MSVLSIPEILIYSLGLSCPSSPRGDFFVDEKHRPIAEHKVGASLVLTGKRIGSGVDFVAWTGIGHGIGFRTVRTDAWPDARAARQCVPTRNVLLDPSTMSLNLVELFHEKRPGVDVGVDSAPGQYMDPVSGKSRGIGSLPKLPE